MCYTKKLLPIFLFCIMLNSCSDPLDKKYSEATFLEDSAKIKEGGKVNQVDAETFAKYVVSAKLLGKDLNGKTYKQIITEAKEVKIKFDAEQAEQQKLAAIALAKQEAKMDELKKALKIVLFEKTTYKENFQNFVGYKFNVQNLSGKEIRAYKGVMLFTDLFDTQLYQLTLTNEIDLKPDFEFVWTTASTYNQFIASDQAFADKKLKDLKLIWKPEKIIFKDGSYIDAL